MSSEIHGFCDKRFQPFYDSFAKNFDDDLEIGASLGVALRGKPVVDLWAGWANAKRTRRWRKNTIVPVNSVTKIGLLIALFTLVDRGRIELDAPIARYWPEFAQGGKDKVTVRDFITHQGGVPAFVPPATFDELLDWKRITAHLAAQPHRFDGKKVLCYHPITYGYVLGEVIRRVDGRMPNRFFREVIARPARLDFHMGLTSPLDMLRIAAPTRFVPAADASAIVTEIYKSAPVTGGNTRSWKFLSAAIPSSLGFTNGRSVARMGAILAMQGRLGWRRFLSERMVAEIATEQVYGDDLFIGPIRWGLGLGLDSKEFAAPSPTTIHWGGAGGAWACMDAKTGISVGYTPNNFQSAGGQREDPRLKRLIDAATEVIGKFGDR